MLVCMWPVFLNQPGDAPQPPGLVHKINSNALANATRRLIG